MTRKLSFDIPDTDERGVSPVIGVILMVAITVILAAVIASFVLGFGGSVSNNAQAGVTVDQNDTGSYMDVTLTSLGDGTSSVKCANSNPNSVNNTSSVGGTFYCNGGDNIVAVSDGGEETVIRTDI